MKPDIDGLSADTIVDFLGSIFARRGGEEYLGEPVTMGQHMLQGAAIAERSGEAEEIVVAALLHDIGHFTASDVRPSRRPPHFQADSRKRNRTARKTGVSSTQYRLGCGQR